MRVAANCTSGRHGCRFFLFFVALFCLCTAPRSDAYGKDASEFGFSSILFEGVLSGEFAQTSARTGAALAAYDYAATQLVRLPEVQYAGSASSAAMAEPLDPAGLARAVFGVQLNDFSIEDARQRATIRATAILVTPEGGVRGAVLAALHNRAALEVYSALHEMQRETLEEYCRVSSRVVAQAIISADITPLQQTLVVLGYRLEALELFSTFMGLSADERKDGERKMNLLTEALALAPDNWLVLTCAAEESLKADRPAVALEFIKKALEKTKNFSRAHDVAGACYLRLGLPAMAVSSYSKALELVPARADYYVHRGAAHLVQEEIALMCGDFQKACSLGNCEGLEWARSESYCLGDDK